MWTAIGFAIFAIVIWLLVLLLDPVVCRFRTFEAELAARQPVSDEQMMHRYFSESDVSCEVVGKVRMIFGKHMDYPFEKLLPDDDLTFFWDELDMVDLIRELETTFGICITTGDEFQTPCNIRSVSLLVHELRKNETAVSER